MSIYLPKCCNVVHVSWSSGHFNWEVRHTETSPHCRHTPSGGTGGRMDGFTPCNRIIGNGATAAEARAEAKEYFSACEEVGQ